MGKIKDKLHKKSNLIKITVLILVALLTVNLFVGNFALDIEHIIIDSQNSDKMQGVKIAHISDYHNRKSDLINSAVFKALNEEQPDVIFITGDLIDKNKTDIDFSLEFVKKVCEIAPVYYVTGNHECNVSIESQSSFDNMIISLEEMGVNVLRQKKETVLLSNGTTFNVYGIDDPYFHCSNSSQVTETTDELCSELNISEGYNILLAHHPEQLPVYADYGFDMVFSGHAHGGQGRIFNQGLIAPDQGFFPEYTGGVYEHGETTLILSRGIGNSVVPVRVFNKSHLIFIEFKKQA